MAATTPRKPRAPRAPKQVQHVDDEMPDLIDLDTQSEDEKNEFEKTTPLFRIHGTVYEARTTFSAGEAFQYGKLARERGMDEAVIYAMTQALGEDGWRAFVDYPYMSAENASKIVNQVTSRINPPAADPKSGKK